MLDERFIEWSSRGVGFGGRQAIGQIVEVEMDILDIARQAGMTVVLEARIGRQEYHSVHGSIAALESFAERVRASTAEELQAVEQD